MSDLKLIDIIREAIRLSKILRIKSSDRLRSSLSIDSTNTFIKLSGYGRVNVFFIVDALSIKEAERDYNRHTFALSFKPIVGGFSIDFAAPDSIDRFIVFLQNRFK